MINIGNNEQTQETPQFETASIFERVIAFILDFFLFVSIFIWSFYALVKVGGWIPELWQTKAAICVFWIVFLLYASFFNSGGRKTLGKFLMDIAVVDKNTLEPVGFVKAFIRSLGYIVGIMTSMAGFALALFNKKRRAVQDLMAGTIVVSEREKSPAEAAVISAVGTVLIGLSLFYIYYIFFIMPSTFQKMYVEDANEQLRRIAFLQREHKQMFGAYTQDMVRLGLISGDPVKFQRDIQYSLKRRGFSMGVGRDGFTVKGVAKDAKETEVELTYTDSPGEYGRPRALR